MTTDDPFAKKIKALHIIRDVLNGVVSSGGKNVKRDDIWSLVAPALRLMDMCTLSVGVLYFLRYYEMTRRSDIMDLWACAILAQKMYEDAFWDLSDYTIMVSGYSGLDMNGMHVRERHILDAFDWNMLVTEDKIKEWCISYKLLPVFAYCQLYT